MYVCLLTVSGDRITRKQFSHVWNSLVAFLHYPCLTISRIIIFFTFFFFGILTFTSLVLLCGDPLNSEPNNLEGFLFHNYLISGFIYGSLSFNEDAWGNKGRILLYFLCFQNFCFLITDDFSVVEKLFF